MADYDRGYRTQFRSYGGSDRRLEIVSGKVYSATHPTYVTRATRPQSPDPPPRTPLPPIRKPKSSGTSSSSSSGWGFGDPEMKRRRRVASYKAYALEGKVKASIRKGVRWIKTKCSNIVRGF